MCGRRALCYSTTLQISQNTQQYRQVTTITKTPPGLLFNSLQIGQIFFFYFASHRCKKNTLKKKKITCNINKKKKRSNPLQRRLSFQIYYSAACLSRFTIAPLSFPEHLKTRYHIYKQF